MFNPLIYLLELNVFIFNACYVFPKFKMSLILRNVAI